MHEIRVDHTAIPFPPSPFYIGQRVKVREAVGYVVGLHKGKYSWKYLVVMGDPPVDDNAENWYSPSQIAPDA